MAKMTFDPLIVALREAGLADDNTRRVVIDINAGDAPIVYIERFCDDKVLKVIATLQGVEITRDEGGQ